MASWIGHIWFILTPGDFLFNSSPPLRSILISVDLERCQTQVVSPTSHQDLLLPGPKATLQTCYLLKALSYMAITQGSESCRSTCYNPLMFIVCLLMPQHLARCSLLVTGLTWALTDPVNTPLTMLWWQSPSNRPNSQSQVWAALDLTQSL